MINTSFNFNAGYTQQHPSFGSKVQFFTKPKDMVLGSNFIVDAERGFDLPDTFDLTEGAKTSAKFIQYLLETLLANRPTKPISRVYNPEKNVTVIDYSTVFRNTNIRLSDDEDPAKQTLRVFFKDQSKIKEFALTGDTIKDHPDTLGLFTKAVERVREKAKSFKERFQLLNNAKPAETVEDLLYKGQDLKGTKVFIHDIDSFLESDDQIILNGERLSLNDRDMFLRFIQFYELKVVSADRRNARVNLEYINQCEDPVTVNMKAEHVAVAN